MKKKTGLFVFYILQIVSLFLPWFTYNAKVMGYCWGTQYIIYFLIPIILVGIYLFSVRIRIVHVIFAEFGAIMNIILLVLIFGTWQEGRNIVAGFRWGDGFRTAQLGFWVAAACSVVMFVLLQYNVFLSSKPALDTLDKKRIVAKFLIVSIILILAVCFLPFDGTKMMDMESDIYTTSQLQDAVRMIREKVAGWKGCKLYSIWYAGDETCLEELNYCNTLNNGLEPYTQCLVFQTNFRSPIFGGGAWQANMVYHWSWYFARTDGGEWELLTWGYP